jgi:hypothetical protein
MDTTIIAAELTIALDLPRVGPYLYLFDLCALTSLQWFEILIDNMGKRFLYSLFEQCQEKLPILLVLYYY